MRYRGTVAPVGLGALVLLLFSDSVFRGRVFYERDLHLDWYTQMESFARSVAAGSLPLWDTTLAFGQPLLADPSAQILYPVTWLNLVMRPWWCYTVFVVFHSGLAALGTHRLGTRIGLSRLGALTAAAVWIASGPFLSMVNTWQHFAGAAWIPWVLVAALRALESPSLRTATTWGAVAAGQVFAGSADVCLMTALLSGGLIARRIEWRTPTARANRRLLAHAAAATGLAMLLSAAVWLPALDIARGSSRWNYPEDVRTAWSLPPAALPGLVLPLSDEGLSLLHPGSSLHEGREGGPLLASLYLGLPCFAFVGLALGSRGTPWRWSLGGTLAAALLASLGSHTPFFPAAAFVVPLLRAFRYPSKAMIVASLAWALLAGLGVDAWGGARTWTRRPAAALVALPLLLMLGEVLPSPGWGALAELAPSERLRLAFAVVSGAVVLILLWRDRLRPSAPWPSVAAVLVVADLVVAHRGLNRTAPAALVSFRPPVIEAVTATDHSRIYVYDYMTPGSSQRYLKRDDPYAIYRPGPGASVEDLQVLSQRLYPFPPVAGRWGLEGSYDLDLRGLYPLPLGDLVQFLRRVEGTPAHRRLLELGAVRSVVALHTVGFEDLGPPRQLPSLFPDPIRIFRVPDPLPRAYAVGGVRVAEGGAALGALVDPSFEPNRDVVLSAGVPRASEAGFHATARLATLAPDRVEIDADLSADGYVVLVDSYDPGWTATLDGSPADVVRANVAFRAVGVPAGHHYIVMRYRPPAVLWGLAASALAWAALAVTASLRGGTAPPTGSGRPLPG